MQIYLTISWIPSISARVHYSPNRYVIREYLQRSNTARAISPVNYSVIDTRRRLSRCSDLPLLLLLAGAFFSRAWTLYTAAAAAVPLTFFPSNWALGIFVEVHCVGCTLYTVIWIHHGRFYLCFSVSLSHSSPISQRCMSSFTAINSYLYTLMS